MDTTVFVGRCVARTAEFVVLTCCPPAPDAPRTALDGAARRLVDALSDAADGGAAPPALRPPVAALSAWAACGFSLLSATRGDGAAKLVLPKAKEKRGLLGKQVVMGAAPLRAR